MKMTAQQQYAAARGFKGSTMMPKKGKRMTQSQDDIYDNAHNQKEGSKADLRQDKKFGINESKKKVMKKGK